MSTLTWELIRFVAIWPLTSFGYALLMWKVAKFAAYRTLAMKFRPFVPAFTGAWLVASWLAYGNPFHPIRLLFAVVVMWGWWVTRDKNEWKRRRRAAAKKVAEVAGRLVVVPATGGAQ
jgi:hypothetical protein